MGKQCNVVAPVKMARVVPKRPSGPVELDFIVRVCQCVFDELGMGHGEKVYQRGIGTILDSLEIFNRLEVIAPTYMMDNVVGSGRIDVIVGRWVLELKAINSVPSKASGQLIKYLKSTNKFRTDEFQKRRVRSRFFKESPDEEGSIIDDEYSSATDSVKQELFSGVVINFNQRTGDVQVCCVIPPDHQCLQTPHCSSIIMDTVDVDYSFSVGKFVRCCLDITDNSIYTVPVSTVARAYEEFTGHALPPMRTFKNELARHVKIETSSAVRGRRGMSEFAGEQKLVCIGVRLIS